MPTWCRIRKDDSVFDQSKTIRILSDGDPRHPVLPGVMICYLPDESRAIKEVIMINMKNILNVLDRGSALT